MRWWPRVWRSDTITRQSESDALNVTLRIVAGIAVAELPLDATRDDVEFLKRWMYCVRNGNASRPRT